MMNLLNNNPNRIKQDKNGCIHCGKSYKNKANLEKHYVLCDLIYSRKTQKVRIEEDEEENLPSQKQMFQIILELSQKYNKLEEKINEINKYVIKKKKKVNIQEWLNENLNPEIVFENITDKVIITTEHIEFLFNNSYNDTLNEILIQIYTLEEATKPIFAFEQKLNTFYIYDITREGQQMWIELTNEKLTRFLNKIQMKMSKTLFEWKQKNIQEIRDNEKLSNLYDKTTIKIMNPNFKQETTLSKIKHMMYSKMKSNMKALIEYEFEF